MFKVTVGERMYGSINSNGDSYFKVWSSSDTSKARLVNQHGDIMTPGMGHTTIFETLAEARKAASKYPGSVIYEYSKKYDRKLWEVL